MLLLGDPLRPEDMFVIVNGVAIPSKSLLECIDLCFKAIYVMWLDYPWQASNVWDFIQKVVYELGDGKPGSKDHITPIQHYLLESFHSVMSVEFHQLSDRVDIVNRKL